MERPAIAPVGASGPPNLPSTNGMPAGHDKPNLSPAFVAQSCAPEVLWHCHLDFRIEQNLKLRCALLADA